jgi:branched-chain amino acid transport system substrate-binding protein
MSKVTRALAAGLLVGSLALVAGAHGDAARAESVKIGALLPLSGALASYGEASQAALEAAREAINAGATDDVELVIEDTKTDPKGALGAMEKLHQGGIRLVIGPYASSEVGAVTDYANANGIVLISPLSTATKLAVAGDNIYRFTPDDEKEGQAVAALAAADGITTVVPVARDDTGNLGLQIAFKPAFEAGGGKVVEGVVYAADEADFNAVAARIAAALEASGGEPGKTAIYLTAFEETAQLFKAASSGDAALAAVPWYGSDGVALSAALVEDPLASSYAVKVGYPNPILGLRDQDRALWGPVVDALEAKLGRRPDSFALAAYDALVVMHQAVGAAGADADAAAIGNAIMASAAAHVGLTGPATLNEAGDRASASFDFWAICPAGESGFRWVRAISYALSPDGAAEIVRTGCE